MTCGLVGLALESRQLPRDCRAGWPITCSYHWFCHPCDPQRRALNTSCEQNVIFTVFAWGVSFQRIPHASCEGSQQSASIPTFLCSCARISHVCLPVILFIRGWHWDRAGVRSWSISTSRYLFWPLRYQTLLFLLISRCCGRFIRSSSCRTCSCRVLPSYLLAISIVGSCVCWFGAIFLSPALLEDVGWINDR